jgi:hypothetical protein
VSHQDALGLLEQLEMPSQVHVGGFALSHARSIELATLAA